MVICSLELATFVAKVLGCQFEVELQIRPGVIQPYEIYGDLNCNSPPCSAGTRIRARLRTNGGSGI